MSQYGWDSWSRLSTKSRVCCTWIDVIGRSASVPAVGSDTDVDLHGPDRLLLPVFVGGPDVDREAGPAPFGRLLPPASLWGYDPVGERRFDVLAPHPRAGEEVA